jgi:hypothetical protein
MCEASMPEEYGRGPYMFPFLFDVPQRLGFAVSLVRYALYTRVNSSQKLKYDCAPGGGQ